VMLAADWHIYQTLTKRADRKAEWFRKYTPADCYVAAQTECNVHPASDPFKTAALLRIKDHKGTFPKSWSEVRHIWDGVSMENQEWADKRMAHHLSTPLPMHWVSAEPLLGPINLDVFLSKLNWGEGPKEWPDGLGALNWVVVGGESGNGARPCEMDWVRAIVKQCSEAGVPVFVKQLGANVVHDGVHGPDPVAFRYRKPIGDGMYRSQLIDRKGGEPSEWPEDLRVREYPWPSDLRI
jgi:protein gp37